MSASHRFDPAMFAPVAITDRNGFDESVHHGAGVIIDADGEITSSIGDPHIEIFPRSSLKPLQASAMLGLGLNVSDRLLAVVVASHSGAAEHLDAVTELLAQHSLTPADLANTADRPVGVDEREASVRAGVTPTPLQQNCSGKHAAMLATCGINNYSTEDYLDVEHPLQQAIIAEINRLVGRGGSAVAGVGIDGCGAPTHVIPLVGLARALATLVHEESPTVRAMRAHPELVGGNDRVDTVWMQTVPGLVAKEGAAGVSVLALPDGRAAAVKIADGSDAARRAVTAQVLRSLGIDVDGEHRVVRDRLASPVLGHGKSVGSVRALVW